MPSRFFCLPPKGKRECLRWMRCNNNLAIILILYIILFGDNMKQYLEIGKLVNTHGIKGELKLDLWCDDVDYVKQFETVYLDDKGSKALTPVAVRPQKNMAIIKFAEITSIEQAEEYKNKIIYGNRDDAVIDDDANYIADLIGCRVVDIETEQEYGTVADVLNHGASDILELADNGTKKYVPVIPDIVKDIDTDGEIIRIKYMQGLFI